jgi:hypothetical protein
MSMFSGDEDDGYSAAAHESPSGGTITVPKWVRASVELAMVAGTFSVGLVFAIAFAGLLDNDDAQSSTRTLASMLSHKQLLYLALGGLCVVGTTYCILELSCWGSMKSRSRPTPRKPRKPTKKAVDMRFGFAQIDQNGDRQEQKQLKVKAIPKVFYQVTLDDPTTIKMEVKSSGPGSAANKIAHKLKNNGTLQVGNDETITVTERGSGRLFTYTGRFEELTNPSAHQTM